MKNEVQDHLTYDFSEQERELARVLYASERYGDHKYKIVKLPPIYALLVKSLRKGENLKAVQKAVQKLMDIKENANA